MMIDIDTLLAWGAAYKKVPRGATIFQEGTTCSFYYQLVSGQIHWLNINDEGKEFIQIIVDPGECFGELPLFDDQPYAATAVAAEDSMIIRLHKPVFKQLLFENQDIHFRFSRLLAQIVRFKFMAVESLASQDPEVRIGTLAYLS